MKRFNLCAFTLIFFTFVLNSLSPVAKAGNRFYFPEGLNGCPGGTVVIPVWGRNDVELKGYSVCMKFDSDVFEVDTLTLAGTRGEGAVMFMPGWTDTTAKAGVVYVYSCPGIPPDSGVILNIVMHIKDDAPIGAMLLDLVAVDPAKNRMTPCEGSVITPTLVDGSFEVLSFPVADFIADTTGGCSPLEVQFTDLSTGDPTEWLWHFGDSDSSTAQNPHHIYTEAGSYTVTLRVTNECGSDKETKVDYITVSEPSHNKFFFPEGLSGCPGDTVVIPVWGRNDVELKGYSVCMKFDSDVFEVDTLTLAGTRGEGAVMFMSGWTDTTVKAGVVYVYSCPGIPPDSGVILNIVMHIKDDARLGTTLLDLVDVDPAKNRMTPCEGSVITPTLIDGSFEVVEPLPDIFISPGSLDFGDVLCRNSSVDTFTIYSLGTGTLKVDSILTPTGFTTDVDTATLSPGDSIVVTVTFAPIDTGFYDGQIKVFSNDPDPGEVPTIVDVSGRGIRYDVGPRMFFGPDTLYPNVPDSVLIRIYNFGNVTAENIPVTSWLEPDSAENETTFVIPTLAAGDSIGYDLKLLFSDSLPCTYVAHICTDLDVDSDSTNNCAQDSFYYTEVKENWHELGVPSYYSLSQNYPNPFNPITEIKYALPKDCQVRLDIFDILGQKVATLVEGRQKAGYKTIRWDAGSFCSGIYFYRLKTGDFIETKKMILLR